MEFLKTLLEDPQIVTAIVGGVAGVIVWLAGKFGFEKLANQLAKKVDEKIDD